MKKTQYLAGIVAVSMMLMGAGYAAWTQNVTVTHQTNLGELKVSFGGSAATSEAYVIKPEVKQEGNTVAVKLGNFYPGAKQGYTVTFENTGTIGAKFNLEVRRALTGATAGTTALTTETYSVNGGPAMNEAEFVAFMNGLTDVKPGTRYTVNVVAACNDFNNGDNEKATETITYNLNISQFNK